MNRSLSALFLRALCLCAVTLLLASSAWANFTTMSPVIMLNNPTAAPQVITATHSFTIPDLNNANAGVRFPVNVPAMSQVDVVITVVGDWTTKRLKQSIRKHTAGTTDGFTPAELSDIGYAPGTAGSTVFVGAEVDFETTTLIDVPVDILTVQQFAASLPPDPIFDPIRDEYNLGSGNTAVVDIPLAPLIPEPSSLILLLGGIGSALTVCRRKC